MLLLCVIGMALFTALGVWQVERRAWKVDLIARVDDRVHGPPQAAPDPARWVAGQPQDFEYQPVTVSGHWLPGHRQHALAVTELGGGWWEMAPLRRDDGQIVWVNRGFVADRASAPDVSAARPVELVGLLRLNEPGGGFLRRNDLATRHWYSRDVLAMSQAAGLDPSRTAPWFVDEGAPGAAPQPPGPRSTAREPVPGLTRISFPNHHAVYAMTWFALAVLCGWALRRTLRPTAD